MLEKLQVQLTSLTAWYLQYVYYRGGGGGVGEVEERVVFRHEIWAVSETEDKHSATGNVLEKKMNEQRFTQV